MAIPVPVVCLRLGISKQAVYDAIAEGVLKAEKVGSYWRVEDESLKNWKPKQRRMFK